MSKLELRALSKTYDSARGRLPALAEVSLSIGAGESLAIVGQSGCGKSTLLRLVAGLETPSAGEIRLDGAPIAGPSLRRGLVFQEPRLFPWLTVAQNIELGLLNVDLTEGLKRFAVRDHIALVGLQGFERAYPHQLSGGMAQRVAIARALVNRPEVLLLDEPFGALDALTRAQLQQALDTIRRSEGLTTILVTHDVEEAVYLGDRVAVLSARPGRLIASVPVALEAPRERGSAAFARLVDAVRDELTAPLETAGAARAREVAVPSLARLRFAV